MIKLKLRIRVFLYVEFYLTNIILLLPRYILNYLRDGELLCPDDIRVQKELLKEAKFYQVQGIIVKLEGKRLHLPSSVIIKNEYHCEALQSWLPPGATFSPLYRSSTDGKRPADFHRYCDNKAPTIVVIKSGEYIFGGYTSKSWQSCKFFNCCFICFRLILFLLSLVLQKHRCSTSLVSWF